MSTRMLPLVLGAAGALAFLLEMIVSGALPQQRQLVKFEAQGVMPTDPLQITRVDIHRGRASASLVRDAAAGWIARGRGPLSPAAAKHATLAVQFMNTAGPIRVMTSEEFQGSAPGEFGLDPPRLSVSLSAGERVALSGRFGSRNPGEIAQYFRVDGRDEMLLMSLFVGQEWEAVADAVLPRDGEARPVDLEPDASNKR